MTRSLFAAITIFLACAVARAEPAWIAHRGSWYNPPLNTKSQYPSNTMPAFEDAVAQGFDGFEFDVFLTRDGQLAVTHDGDMGIATSCKGWVASFSLGELKRDCRVVASQTWGLKSVPAPKPAPVPSLADVLRRFALDPKAKHFMIDVKAGEAPALVEGLRRALAELTPDEMRAVSRKAIVYAPDAESFAAMSRAFPGLSMADELEPKRLGPEERAPKARPVCDYVSTYLDSTSPDFAKQLDAIAAFVRSPRGRAQPLITWLIDDPAAARELVRRVPGVRFILTNMRRSAVSP